MKAVFAVHKLAPVVCSRHHGVCRGAICPAMSSTWGGLPLTRPIRTGVPLRNRPPMSLAETLGLEMLSFGECCRNVPSSSLPLSQCGGSLSSSWSCVDGCKVFDLFWALPDLTLFPGTLLAAYSHVIFRSTMDVQNSSYFRSGSECALELWKNRQSFTFPAFNVSQSSIENLT